MFQCVVAELDHDIYSEVDRCIDADGPELASYRAKRYQVMSVIFSRIQDLTGGGGGRTCVCVDCLISCYITAKKSNDSLHNHPQVARVCVRVCDAV